jgi:hypothetical protein
MKGSIPAFTENEYPWRLVVYIIVDVRLGSRIWPPEDQMPNASHAFPLTAVDLGKQGEYQLLSD